MKAVKRMVVLGATAGLIMAGAGAAVANDGHSQGKSEKKHSKHYKHGKKHGKKHGDKKVLVNKNTGAQGISSRNWGIGSGDLIQSDLIELNHVQACNNSGGILAAQNASINNSCANAPQID